MLTINLLKSFLASALLFVAFSVNADSESDLPVDEVEGKFSVMVLGSGGPVAMPSGRASSGYLIFIDGVPRILMDMGGGTFKNLAASGARIPNLDRFLLTHLHLDHTADMSAIVKTIFFHNLGAGLFRTAPFNFYGPAANGFPFPPAPPLVDGAGVPMYPDTTEYVDGHYDIQTGMERYLNAFSLGIKGGLFKYEATDLSPDFRSDAMEIVFEADYGSGPVVVKSIAVKHGPVPAVAYRIEYAGKSIVWSGDTSSETGNMIKIATDADLLIYDTAIMADQPPPGTIFQLLHTIPERIGEVAAIANPKKLVLSHITPVTEPRLKEAKQIIKNAGYTGKIKAAKDLKVYNLFDEDDD